MNKSELLNTLKIDKDEFYILSSGALVLRGIYPNANDLDIAVTTEWLIQFLNGYYEYLINSTREKDKLRIDLVKTELDKRHNIKVGD